MGEESFNGIDGLKLYQASIENKEAIKSLIKLQEKTSSDIDKLVEKQTELMMNQTELKVIEERILENSRDIKEVKEMITYRTRTIFGGFLTLLIGIILVGVKSTLNS